MNYNLTTKITIMGSSRLDSLIEMMSLKTTDDVLRQTISNQISMISRNYPENSVYILDKLEKYITSPNVSLSTQRIFAKCTGTIIRYGDESVYERYTGGLKV